MSCSITASSPSETGLLYHLILRKDLHAIHFGGL
jgi:hypothetical protein